MSPLEEKLETLNALKSTIISAEAASVFSEEDIKTLCRYAFDDSDHEAEPASIALKCIANVLLLEKKSRQYFADQGYAPRVAKRLRNSPQDELLCSRILFLLTYDTKFDFEDLFQHDALADSIHENITTHASRYVQHKHKRQQADVKTSDDEWPTLEPAALTESLKLLFNINKFYPDHVPDFDRTKQPILTILNNKQPEALEMQQPNIALINSLLGLELPGPVSPGSDETTAYSPLFPKDHPYDNILRLLDILQSGVQTSKEEDLDGLVPLVTLLRRTYEIAPPHTKTEMQAQLLPSNEERSQPLGKSETLASRLLRLSTAPTVPRLKEGISSLLFELSDQDAATFVRNVGYGFAAGYLMTHNIPMPPNAAPDSGERMTTVDGQAINPITGQRRDMEPEDPLPAMTDEEREREAERLFVLFERLRATGVMNVVNPVEQAVNEGRFEEVE